VPHQNKLFDEMMQKSELPSVTELPSRVQQPSISTHIVVEYSTEDENIAAALKSEFEALRYSVALVNTSDADAAPTTIDTSLASSSAPKLNRIRFVLMSYDKTKFAEAAADEIVIPIIIENCDIPDELARVQWIDIRRGMQNHFGRTLAYLLDKPSSILETLGTIPTKQVSVRPGPVDYLISSFQVLLIYKVLWGVCALLGGALGMPQATPVLQAVLDTGGVILLSALALRGVQTREITYRRLMQYAKGIFGLTWILSIVFLCVTARREGGAIHYLTSLELLGVLGNFFVHLLPPLILLLARTSQLRFWLRKT